MENALELGKRLKQEELEKSRQRIQDAIPGNWIGTTNRNDRILIANLLYEAFYDNKRYDIITTAQETLDNFCSEVFHCSFSEMLKAYDKFLE